MVDYNITLRPAITAFPVPVMSSGTIDTVLAFDLCPKGDPPSYGNHGYTWIDLCDKDILAMDAGDIPVQGLSSARIGINDTSVWLGSMTFNGATPKPVEVIVGGIPKIKISTACTYVIDTLTIGTDSTTPGVSNTIYGASISKLGTGYFSRSGFPTAIFNRGETGQVIQLRMAGNLIGSITVTSTGVTLSGFKQIDDLLSRVSALEALT